METTTAAWVKVKAGRCSHGPKEEVFIFIAPDACHNTIFADLEEHVPSKVNFFAGSPCTLYFEKNNKIFEKDKYSLQVGDNWLTPTGTGSTAYSINQPVGPVSPRDGPIIHVP